MRRLILAGEIKHIEKQLLEKHRTDATSRRLATIPGIGPITASAIAATVPDVSLFRSGRQFAASAVIRMTRKNAADLGWVAQLLERKRPKIVAVALANKMARIAWAVVARDEIYVARAA